MKKVLSPDMVAHVWANKGQDSARNAGDTFYFKGATIYSWGRHFPIASHLENGRVLWNDSAYSQSTARHKNHVWQAMSRSQTADRIDVPSLSDDKIENLRRIHARVIPLQMPEVVQACADAVIALVQGIAGMRSVDKMNATLQSAREYQQSGVDLLDYARNGKGRAIKWPVPMLPDAVPADKVERAAWIRSIAKSQFVAEYDKALIEFGRTAKVIRSICEHDQSGWHVQNLPGNLAGMERALGACAKAYESAHAKPMPKATRTRMLAEITTLQSIVTPIVEAWQDKQAQAEARMLKIDAFKMLRNRAVSSSRGRWGSKRLSGYIQSKMDSVHRASDHIGADLLARVRRVAQWDQSADALIAAESNLETAQSYFPAHPEDALSIAKSAASNAYACGIHAEFYDVKHARIDAVRTAADALIEQAKAIVTAKHATRVADWQAGTISYLGHDAGTFARLSKDGTEIETNRGARVPVEHACRLARMYRIAVRKGGAAWADGTGPMVGHFRVEQIGVDGSLVIGCHEFDGAEGARLLALLDACPACADVTVDA